MQPVDDAAHALRRIILDVAHIGAGDRQGEIAHHLAQFAYAHLVGGDLRLDVVDVLQRIARRIFGALQELIGLFLAEAAAFDQFEIIDIDAFLLDGRGVRRHRARRNAADVGMMAARGDPEQDLAAVEYRRADSDVRKVRAAVIRRVDGIDVAGAYFTL